MNGDGAGLAASTAPGGIAGRDEGTASFNRTKKH
jgi:hypothetical protein